jgi:hypothetical protein
MLRPAFVYLVGLKALSEPSANVSSRRTRNNPNRVSGWPFFRHLVLTDFDPHIRDLGALANVPKEGIELGRRGLVRVEIVPNRTVVIVPLEELFQGEQGAWRRGVIYVAVAIDTEFGSFKWRHRLVSPEDVNGESILRMQVDTDTNKGQALSRRLGQQGREVAIPSSRKADSRLCGDVGLRVEQEEPDTERRTVVGRWKMTDVAALYRQPEVEQALSDVFLKAVGILKVFLQKVEGESVLVMPLDAHRNEGHQGSIATTSAQVVEAMPTGRDMLPPVSDDSIKRPGILRGVVDPS